MMMRFFFYIPVLLFLISCESGTQSGGDKDTVVVVQEEGATERAEDTTRRRNISENRRELDRRIDSLERRMENATAEAKRETNEAIERWKQKRDSILADTTAEKLENEWEEFEKEVTAALDSLEKKIE